ncbi:MAG: DUF481 domain-containing protein [Acidiferrobacter sp.]
MTDPVGRWRSASEDCVWRQEIPGRVDRLSDSGAGQVAPKVVARFVRVFLCLRPRTRLWLMVNLCAWPAWQAMTSPVAQATKVVASKPGLRGEIGAGLSSTSGVALTDSINSNDRVRYRTGLWDYGGNLSYNYFSYDSAVGVNRLVAKLQARRTLHHAPVSFLVGSVRYDHNLFDGYSYYVVEMLNAGQRVVHTSTMHLDLEAGGGARQNTYPNGRAWNDEPVADMAMKYVWHIRPRTRFSQTLSVVGARTGTLVTSSTGVSTTLDSHLALKVSEEIIHYTSLPSTALVHYAKTTTFTTLNLIYHIS